MTDLIQRVANALAEAYEPGSKAAERDLAAARAAIEAYEAVRPDIPVYRIRDGTQ